MGENNYRYRGGRARAERDRRQSYVDPDMGINRHLYESPMTMVAVGRLVVIPMWEPGPS